MPVQNLDAQAQLTSYKQIRGDEVDPCDIQNASLRKGLELWQALRGARLFPSRAEMSPRALGPLLRNTILVKVLDGGRDFQLRVIGDAIMSVQNDPIQGLTTAEIEKLLPGFGKVLHKNYNIVRTLKRPIARRGQFYREADKRLFHREHLMLPLGETDEAVDHIISLIVYTNPYG